MKPIIFSTEMVKAILDGIKTQTRRIINGVPDGYNFYGTRVGSFNREDVGKLIFVKEGQENVVLNRDEILIKPKYQVGDILWVRETWYDLHFDQIYYIYKANNEPDSKEIEWKSPYHMPKEAARIFLKVTNVRVERLQEITEDDCYSEGIIPFERKHCGACSSNDCDNPIGDFKYLWDKLNKKRGYGWDKNPWVWVYEFERVDKPAEITEESE